MLTRYGLDLRDAQVPSKRSAPTSKPKAQVKKEDADAAEQIAGDSDEDEDEEQVARRKRPSLGRGVKARGSMVVDSEDSDGAPLRMVAGRFTATLADVRSLHLAASSTPPKPKASTGGKAAGKKGGAKGKVKGKGKSKGDDDDFSGASSGSDDDSMSRISSPFLPRSAADLCTFRAKVPATPTRARPPLRPPCRSPLRPPRPAALRQRRPRLHPPPRPSLQRSRRRSAGSAASRALGSRAQAAAAAASRRAPSSRGRYVASALAVVPDETGRRERQPDLLKP